MPLKPSTVVDDESCEFGDLRDQPRGVDSDLLWQCGVHVDTCARQVSSTESTGQSLDYLAVGVVRRASRDRVQLPTAPRPENHDISVRDTDSVWLSVSLVELDPRGVQLGATRGLERVGERFERRSRGREQLLDLLA